ncbi:MAG: NUDIX domain-containing protein [Nanoarchaeota archaeon]|nr:NUDIX domain-containing protein [Nanoarchaeota archaeon]
MKLTKSAGGVVLNQDKILVVNQNNDSWSLPKGHIDPGEDALTAARREIKEESGVTELTFIKDLGSYERPKIGKHGEGDEIREKKHITLFLFRTDQQELKPEDPENPEARWVDIHEVTELLTHKKDKEFFDTIKSELN